jgi:auxin responsive GH3 family protein
MNKPNPELATKIAMECSKEDWGGIIPRLFPNTQLVECIVSGSMHQYVPALQHFSGHLPISSPLYGLSEAHYVGFNATGNGSTTAEETYMLWPEAAYFEFIPEDKFGGGEDGNKEDGFRVLEVGDLELGRDYELLLTTVSGMYNKFLLSHGIMPLNQPSGVHCTKHVRVYVSAHKGY